MDARKRGADKGVVIPPQNRSRTKASTVLASLNTS
jgi:hypothetical protein